MGTACGAVSGMASGKVSGMANGEPLSWQHCWPFSPFSFDTSPLSNHPFRRGSMRWCCWPQRHRHVDSVCSPLCAEDSRATVLSSFGQQSSWNVKVADIYAFFANAYVHQKEKSPVFRWRRDKFSTLSTDGFVERFCIWKEAVRQGTLWILRIAVARGVAVFFCKNWRLRWSSDASSCVPNWFWAPQKVRNVYRSVRLFTVL